MAKLIDKLKPFIMIMFLVVAVFGVINLAKYVKLQPQIKEKCGWEDEGVKCFCEKNIYYQKQDEYSSNDSQIKLEYIGNTTIGDLNNGT